jgi:PAS domain S-box-containing protein
MAAEDDETADAGDSRGDAGKLPQSIDHHRSRIRVLHVDDAPRLVEMQREHLEQHDQRIELAVARSVVEGRERLAEEAFDCIVSDYAMPGTNGIEFCERVREAYPELPFILYTSRRCESVASEMLSAGVTDYVQKESGTAHLAILADRIVTAVESRHSRRTRNRLLDAMEAIADGIALLDGDGRFTYVDDAYADHVGTDSEALVGQDLGDVFERDTGRGEQLRREAEDTGRATTTVQADGSAIAGEHTLVKTAPDMVVCTIHLRGDDRTGDG